ncbi:MAG: sugar phosphate isomerase/epimerase family protein [Ruminococcus sp.]
MEEYKLGICMWGFPQEGPEGLRLAAGLGLQGAEISLGSFEEGYPMTDPFLQKEYCKISRDCRIELVSLSVEHLNQYGLSNPSSSRRGRIALEGSRRGLEAAARMEIPVVQLPSFNDGAIRTEEDFENTCEKISILCEEAAAYGIIIATENVLSVEDSRRMMKKIGCGNFKLMFDTQNYFLDHGADTAEVLRELYPYVIQIHLKDGYNGKISSALLGRGETHFLQTAGVIKETACTRWLLLENYYDRPPLNQMCVDPVELVQADMKTVKTIFEMQ